MKNNVTSNQLPMNEHFFLYPQTESTHWIRLLNNGAKSEAMCEAIIVLTQQSSNNVTTARSRQIFNTKNWPVDPAAQSMMENFDPIFTLAVEINNAYDYWGNLKIFDKFRL